MAANRWRDALQMSDQRQKYWLRTADKQTSRTGPSGALTLAIDILNCSNLPLQYLYSIMSISQWLLRGRFPREFLLKPINGGLPGLRVGLKLEFRAGSLFRFPRTFVKIPSVRM